MKIWVSQYIISESPEVIYLSYNSGLFGLGAQRTIATYYSLKNTLVVHKKAQWLPDMLRTLGREIKIITPIKVEYWVSD